MSEMKLQFKGPAAIVALVAVLAVGAYQYFGHFLTLNDEGVEVIKTRLRSEYLIDALPSARAAVASGDPATASAAAERLMALERIEIDDISARGKKDNIIVRVKFRVDGNPPPDAKDIRYFRMKHSLARGWEHRGETSALFYHLKLW